MAWVGSTVGFQPETVPSSVAKMKRLAALVVPFETAKSAVLLKTWPVGLDVVPAGLPAGGGIVTISACFVPAVLKSVVRPVPLSETQVGLVALCDMPHGFTRSGSVWSAIPGMSESRLTCVNVVEVARAGRETTARLNTANI